MAMLETLDFTAFWDPVQSRNLISDPKILFDPISHRWITTAINDFLLATSSLAVGTRTFQLDSQERFSGGELKGAFVDADGVVKPGFATAGTVLDASTAWSARYAARRLSTETRSGLASRRS